MLTLKKNLIENQSPKEIVCGRHTLRLSKRTYVMGILNRTPDSFSDGGDFMDEGKALRHIEQMVKDGADIIDIGGESTRPGSEPVSVKEELNRVIPLIKKAALNIDVPISIDTQKSDVAEAALQAGASMVNDITALRGDHRMRYIVAKYNVPVVLMHMKGTPKTMQIKPEYENLFSEITLYLRQCIDIAREAGILDEKIIIDPGIGFGKTTEHNLSIIKNLNNLKVLKKPILIGTSRKSFIGDVLNLDVNPVRNISSNHLNKISNGVKKRLMGTAAAVVISILNGANIIRVHDIRQIVEVARLADAVRRTK